MSNPVRWIPAGIICLAILVVVPSAGTAADPLDDVKARQAIEAQRLEKEFARERSAAYRLVRNDNPQLTEATQKLRELLDLVQADTALDTQRRKVFIVTLKADMDRVRDIASERTRAAAPPRRSEIEPTRRDDLVRTDAGRPVTPTRRPGDEARSVYDARRRAVEDVRDNRLARADRVGAIARSVEKSAIPEAGNIRFDAEKWREITRRRSTGQKMTDKERKILKVLDSTINVDYSKNSLEEVFEHLRKATKVDIAVDKRALDEVGASYESTVTLKMKSSVRTVLRRILADLNLAYVIKDEVIQITSRERASQMTVAKVYYLGDLATVVDSNLPPFVSQALAIQNVTNLINLITSTVEPQSWKVNNPDAPGTITFDPIRLSLVVKQTAEVHFKLGSR